MGIGLCHSRWVLATLLLCFALAGVAEKSADALQTELRAAIDSAKGGSAKKVAVMRLKRALKSAREVQGVSAALLEEGEAALRGSSEAEGRLQAAREALQKALDTNEVAMLEEALKNAKEVGLVKSTEFTHAEEALAQKRKEQKKVEKRKGKQAKLRVELKEFSSQDAGKVNITALRNALSLGKAQLPEEDKPLLQEAQDKLKDAEWLALPLAVRLDKISTEFGRSSCSPPSGQEAMMCVRFTDADLIERSRKVGEANCDHPSLRPGGEVPNVPNALPSETAKNFCKYPPSFDLKDGEDGKGYRVAEFEFPSNLFNTTALQQDGLTELSVMNLDLDFFRSGIATCGELWLIEFYVHWCPHCMALMPKFYKLAVAIRSSGSKLRLGAVNCAVQRELCGAFQVMGHPLLAFFYASGAVPGGQVQLFEYSGRDVRVNSALDYLKANRPPAWDAGAPADYDPPKHLFPGEAVSDVLRLLPEEYRPSEPVLRWIGNSSRTSATVCAEVRSWNDRKDDSRSSEADEVDSNSSETGATRRPSKFPGNGWPMFELGATPAHRVQDAAQAIVYTLEEWVIPNAAGGSPHAFAFQELTDLHKWVTLLTRLFPSAAEGGPDLPPALLLLKKNLGSTIQKVNESNGQAALCHEEWQKLVKPVRHALDISRSKQILIPLCRTETCRMWTLLHVLTVAKLARLNRPATSAEAIEQSELNAGAELVSVDVADNGQVFDTLTNFLQRYFTCQTCRKHFLEQVAAESYELRAARSGGPQELALWWWHLHTAVSARVAKEGKCRADRRWPPADVCHKCWENKTATNTKKKAFLANADEDLSALELVSQYWPHPSNEAPSTAADM
jgi:thiol-disulfide isomerase/thioredoxin